WNKQCYFSQRREVPLAVAGKQGAQQWEHLARRGSDPGDSTRPYEGTARAADYLDHYKRQRGSPPHAPPMHMDAGVGFAFSKGDAKIEQAMQNLGQGHVHGVWAYQGSKPFVSRGRLYSALGDTLHCVDPHTEEVFWKKTPRECSDTPELLDSVL